MPIYAYKCDACGHARDVLQKMSDAPLTDCPACGVAAFAKQLTAAGFQLKGSGWYATDFKGGASTPAAPSGGTETGGAADSKPATTEGKPETKSAETAAKPSTAPAASAGGCSTGCACH